MFDSFKKHWKLRRKVRFDRNNLEERSRRFLKDYLEADDMRKTQFYRAVEDISRRCQPVGFVDLNDSKIAEATSEAAMQIILQLNADVNKDQSGDFLTDAYATVAIAYRRAAGVYSSDEELQELGTAAVHLLTMATSYSAAQKE